MTRDIQLTQVEAMKPQMETITEAHAFERRTSDRLEIVTGVCAYTS